MKKRVLIIEDEREIALIIKMRLEAVGYDVLEAFDGSEGLRCAKSCSPDLILLDLVLPKISGMKILEELKGDARYRDIPIVVVTGLTEEAHNLKASTSKADAFFLKPFDTIELLAAVADLLKESRKD